MRSAAALALGLAAAACDEPGSEAAIRELRITAPAGSVELVPVDGEGLRVEWTAEVDGAVELDVGLMPDRAGDPAIHMGTVPASVDMLQWSLPGIAPRAGTYRVVATAYGDGRALATAAASAIVVMQGVEFDARALAFTAADVDREVELTVTVGQPIAIELAATPTGAATPRYALATANVASDLAPIGRSFRWSGVALDGTALPAGGYDVSVRVEPQARPGASYDVGGLVVTWTP